LALGVTPVVAVHELLALKQLPAGDRAYLLEHGHDVLEARASAPGQWQRWWWICAIGQIVFLPTIFLLVGRWSPAAAKREREEHEAAVERERLELAAGTL
jgi:MFS transporter, ACS family, D-galactonate transporter